MNIPEDLADKDLKAVFVDLDGTLVDSLPRLYEIYLSFLKSYGIEGSRVEFDQINGPSLPEVLEILKARHLLPDTVEDLIDKYQDLVFKIYADENLVMKGAVETLQYLKQKQMQLFLVTSATKGFVNYFLAHFPLGTVFQETVTGDMVKRGKPDPEIYRLALVKAQVLPAQAVVIEDSMHGVHAAMDAGMYVFRLNHSNREIQWHQGWVEINDWKTILKVIQQMLEIRGWK